jgi:HPr kinase/phosphorylase
MTPFNIHATTVAIRDAAGREHGVLIRGVPGSGKSELALRLIDAAGFGAGDAPLRARLVADDQTLLSLTDGQLVAMAPAALAGQIEVRGVGILHLPHVPSVPVSLVVDLRQSHDIERLPDERLLATEIAGISLPRIVLDQSQPAAPAIVRMILTARLRALPDGGQKA